MKSVVVLLFCLTVFALSVLASEEDVRCVVHSDSCTKCLENSCAWCSEGFCIGLQTDICPPEKLNTTCPMNVLASNHELEERQQTSCFVQGCTTCSSRTDCQVCFDASTGLTKCHPTGESCATTDFYDPGFYFYQTASFNFQSGTGANCPAVNPVPDTIVNLLVFSFGFPGGGNIENFIQQLCILIFRAYSSSLPAGFDIHVRNLIVLITKSLNFKRAQAIETAITLKNSSDALLKLGAAIEADPSKLPDGVGTVSYGQGYVDANGNLIQIPSTPSPTGVNRTITKGNGKVLSKGALAGVIIGVFFGALIIFAIIAYLVIRRRETYPLPFRSPAAAYRP